MTDQRSTFRDFGILPDNLPTPPDRVQTFLSQRQIIEQYVTTGFVSAVGMAVVVFLALYMPQPLGFVACLATLVAFAVFVFLATINDYHWIELDRNVLRAKHLYGGRVLEQTIDQIEGFMTIANLSQRTEAFWDDKILGRVKGIEICFREHPVRLRIMRIGPAMANAEQFIQAVLYHLQMIRELDVQVVQVRKRPLIRSIYCKGSNPPKFKGFKTILGCTIALSLLLGIVLSFCGVQERERQIVGSVAPQEVTLSYLIQFGPGTNRHVTITDFEPGGYSAQVSNGTWTQAWVALFPAGERPTEIKAVLETRSVGGENSLRQMLQAGRITGICSQTPTSNWGATLGPELRKSNRGLPLSSAWSIDEMQVPPSAAYVSGLMAGAYICYFVIVVIAGIAFWKLLPPAMLT